MPENFTTFDYFPLFPWLGVLMFGIYSREKHNDKTSHIKFNNKSAEAFFFWPEFINGVFNPSTLVDYFLNAHWIQGILI